MIDRRPPFHPTKQEHAMHFKIEGTNMPTLLVDLGPGEVVYSQTNCMAWMSDTVDMQTHTGGGFFAGLKRTFGGGSFFITDFTARTASRIAFAPRFPGSI